MITKQQLLGRIDLFSAMALEFRRDAQRRKTVGDIWGEGYYIGNADTFGRVASTLACDLKIASELWLRPLGAKQKEAA